MLECNSILGKTVKTKSADQILEELFTTLVQAPSDAEPPPPGDDLPPISHPVIATDLGSNETSKPKKKKKDKKKKKKRKKEDHDDNDVIKVKEKKSKKSKKEKKDRNEKEVYKVEELEPKSKRIRTEEKVVAEPKPEVAEPKPKVVPPKLEIAKPNEGHSKKSEKSIREEKLDKKIIDRIQKTSHANKESSNRSNRSRTSPPARRRSSRSPNVQRRTGATSVRRSRSPHRRKNRSRSPSPYNNRRTRRSSKSPIVLHRPKRSPSSPRIDKVQLLEVARQNLKRMQELGTLPANLSLPASVQQQNAGSSVPKATGKTVAELTDYCKNLVNLPDNPKMEPDENAPSSFTRHPFQIKPRPDTIVMNIRNAVPLPVRKPEERVTLKHQFPVSSGAQHQDLEWVPVPVSPPEPPGKTAKKKEKPNAVVAPTPREINFPAPVEPPIDISTIVAKRISSIRKLQENEEDIEAQLELQETEMMTQSWANYHHTNPMTGEPLPELINWSGAPQAWAKKDQFVRAAPVAGGVGMRLLQKMGWQPGEGLGRNKEGTLEPLAMDIKMDKKGLLSKEETAPLKHNLTNKLMVEFQGKHPVSILHELCVKNRWEPPNFEQVADIGPDHLKHFLFKVKVNGIEYQPSVASTTKKEAKAQAAAVCLLSLGIKMTFQ